MRAQLAWILALSSLASFPAAVGGGERPIVVVFEAEFKDVRLPAGVREKLNDYLDSLLAESGFQVVPRAQLRERLRVEKSASYKNCYDQACQIEIGKELAAQKTLTTRVMRLGGKCVVALTLYDLKKAASEAGKTVAGTCDEPGIVASLEEGVKQLMGGGTPGKPGPAGGGAAAGLIWILSKPAGVELTRSEVTVAQYRACVTAGRCTLPQQRRDQSCTWGEAGKDDHPVNCVSFGQADVFCEWAGGRLPSEKEWQAEASNGGHRQYPWGDQPPTCELAVMREGGIGCGRDSTWVVCSKPAGNSVSGLCDMSGSVPEWTSSLFEKDSRRVVRGGSLRSDPALLQVAYRSWDEPAGNLAFAGFRCARPAP